PMRRSSRPQSSFARSTARGEAPACCPARSRTSAAQARARSSAGRSRLMVGSPGAGIIACTSCAGRVGQKSGVLVGERLAGLDDPAAAHGYRTLRAAEGHAFDGCLAGFPMFDDSVEWSVLVRVDAAVDEAAGILPEPDE